MEIIQPLSFSQHLQENLISQSEALKPNLRKFEKLKILEKNGVLHLKVI